MSASCCLVPHRDIPNINLPKGSIQKPFVMNGYNDYKRYISAWMMGPFQSHILLSVYASSVWLCLYSSKPCAFQVQWLVSNDLAQKQTVFNSLLIHYLIIIMCISHGNTVGCHYNSVNFLENPHKRHPIAGPFLKNAGPLGRGMGCLLWIHTLIYVMSWELQRSMQNHVILNCVIMAQLYTCIYYTITKMYWYCST